MEQHVPGDAAQQQASQSAMATGAQDDEADVTLVRDVHDHFGRVASDDVGAGHDSAVGETDRGLVRDPLGRRVGLIDLIEGVVDELGRHARAPLHRYRALGTDDREHIDTLTGGERPTGKDSLGPPSAVGAVVGEEDRCDRRAADHEDGTGRMVHHLGRDGAEQHGAPQPATAAADHDQVCLPGARLVDDRRSGTTAQGECLDQAAGGCEIVLRSFEGQSVVTCWFVIHIDGAVEASPIERGRADSRDRGDDPDLGVAGPVERRHDRDREIRLLAAIDRHQDAHGHASVFMGARPCSPRSIGQRATTTVVGACVARCSETLPWSTRSTGPSPRDPTTMMS